MADHVAALLDRPSPKIPWDGRTACCRDDGSLTTSGIFGERTASFLRTNSKILLDLEMQ